MPYNLDRLPLALCILASVGCSSNVEFINPVDRQERVDLSLPPDLTQPIDSGFLPIPDKPALPSTSKKSGGGVKGTSPILAKDAVILHRQQQERWLVIDASKGAVWRMLEKFWEEGGTDLRIAIQDAGIMETLWLKGREHRFVEETRDKYRLRLEDGESGKTELFLTHYGAVKKGENWKQRSRDTDMEFEVFQNLSKFAGFELQAAIEYEKKLQQYRLTDSELDIPERFDRAWRLIGITLDRLGVVVNDRNRSEGIYYVSRLPMLDNIDAEESGKSGKLKKKDKPLFTNPGASSDLAGVEETFTEENESSLERFSEGSLSDNYKISLKISAIGEKSRISVDGEITEAQRKELLRNLRTELTR